MYALTWFTPRPSSAGAKLRAIVRTCADVVSSAKRRSGATRTTNGTCTANCSALPATDPQARITDSRGNAVPAPKRTSVAIIATFHITPLAYDRRNRSEEHTSELQSHH